MKEFCKECDAIMEDKSLDYDQKLKRIIEQKEKLKKHANPILKTIIGSY